MRERPKTVLVGLEIDRKEDAVILGSRQAAFQAAWLARASGARLRFLHSTWDDRHAESVGLTEEHRATLEDFVHEFRDEGIPAELVVSGARAWIALIREALAGRGDVIVVGKREREREEGRRLGSVAVKLQRKSPVPVWVVRPEHDLVHRLVLAATDLSDVGQRAVEFAGFVAAQSEGCDLHVVHAYRLPAELSVTELGEAAYAEAVEAFKRSLSTRIRSALPSGAPEPQLHLRKGPPSRAILEIAETMAPDLLCMGSLSRQEDPGMMVGAIAERVLERLACSIWTAKPAEFVAPVRP